MGKIALITGVTGQDGDIYRNFYLKKAIKFMELKDEAQCLIQQESII